MLVKWETKKELSHRKVRMVSIFFTKSTSLEKEKVLMKKRVLDSRGPDCFQGTKTSNPEGVKVLPSTHWLGSKVILKDTLMS
jgi:hypothetical protein